MSTQTLLDFTGSNYSPEHDHARLMRQHERIRDYMLGHGGWYTLDELSEATNAPPASVSAQLRHLRKARFGSWTVQKRRRGDRSNGLYEYHLSEPLVGEAKAS